MTKRENIVMQFHECLDWLQFERDYDECMFLIVDKQVHGFGGQLSRRMLGLQLGYIFGRTVVFCKPNDPPYKTCYQPTGKYTIDDVKHLSSVGLNFTPDRQDKLAYFDFDAFWENEDLKSWFYQWIPPGFRELGYDCPFFTGPSSSVGNITYNNLPSSYNRLFFDGQILTRFNLREEYKNHIEQDKKRIGFRNPIIGVHIRRGDKFVETPYVPLRVIMAQVKKISDETLIRRVFVTSDSDDTFKMLPGNLSLEYIFDEQEQRYNNANHSFVQNNPDLATQETQTATKIIDLLASCDWIVGQNNVHFILLAAALNVARTSIPGRTITVDGNYLGSYSNASFFDWPLVFINNKRNVLDRFLTVSRSIRRKLDFTLSQWK